MNDKGYEIIGMGNTSSLTRQAIESIDQKIIIIEEAKTELKIIQSYDFIEPIVTDKN